MPAGSAPAPGSATWGSRGGYSGSDGGDRDLVLRAAVDAPMFVVNCARLAPDEELRARQLRSIVRETLLAGVRALFSGADRLLEDELFDRIVSGSLRGPILASVRTFGNVSTSRRLVLHTIPVPDREGRLVLWQRSFPHADESVLARCADRYRIPASLIAEVAAGVSGNPTLEQLQAWLRDRLDRRLSGFAKRVDWKQTWDDLVLPADQYDLLVEILSRVLNRGEVIDGWGFGEKVGKGTGTTTLISGPPGTGKTMIAGLLAREIGLDLYQVDLSKVVSKFIGETEQRLAELFDAAEHGQAVILFDEADSLFGKRTEVKSSNDRYANLETNYLLQRLEAFEGICILTTNHESAIDPAFVRRLSAHVRVPTPDEEHREQLWRAMIPTAAKVAGKVAGDIDFRTFAKTFVMSGGHIKNAVVRAAFLAAAEQEPITNGHLLRAARAEYEGMGKVAMHGMGRPTN